MDDGAPDIDNCPARLAELFSMVGEFFVKQSFCTIVRLVDMAIAICCVARQRDEVFVIETCGGGLSSFPALASGEVAYDVD